MVLFSLHLKFTKSTWIFVEQKDYFLYLSVVKDVVPAVELELEIAVVVIVVLVVVVVLEVVDEVVVDGVDVVDVVAVFIIQVCI